MPANSIPRDALLSRSFFAVNRAIRDSVSQNEVPNKNLYNHEKDKDKLSCGGIIDRVTGSLFII